MYLVKREQGFTLLEVVASIVIITIVVISFARLFVQSNNVAHYNNEKLVLINLADAELERVQAIGFVDRVELNHYISTEKKIVMNNKDYIIQVEDTTSSGEEDLMLIHLKVIASINSTKSVAEGYVKIKQ